MLRINNFTIGGTPRRILLGIATVAFIFALSFSVPILHVYLRREPIGDISEYDGFNGTCEWKESILPNGRGVVAALRQVVCSGAPIVPPTRDYFVFIRKPEDKDTAANLILGYRQWPTDAYWDVAPVLTWRTSSSLEVKTGVSLQVSTLRTNIGSIEITFKTGGSHVMSDYGFRRGNGWHYFVP